MGDKEQGDDGVNKNMDCKNYRSAFEVSIYPPPNFFNSVVRSPSWIVGK